MLQENATFNYHLSHVHVKSEHAMGYIKGRFCSLRGLRQQIDNALDHERAVAWIKACIVIHTLIFLIEHGEEDPQFVLELIQEGGVDLQQPAEGEDELAAEVARETQGQRKRERLKADLFEYLEPEAFPFF